jgi:Fic family protein
MQRGRTGDYDVTIAGGEAVSAFVPHPLPPQPPIDLGGTRQSLLEQALLACGRLDGISPLLPDPNLFLYTYVRREAVLSSQIEGTQSSLSDLLLFELNEAPGVPFDDVVEVSNYVAAAELGLQHLRDGLPISSRMLCDVHRQLLARGRGKNKSPGEYRRTQNWIGGTRPGNAAFVPPPPHQLAPTISALESFIHAGHPLPALVKAALAHVQFETIHPFLDGNGRVGRLLIVLMIIDAGLLKQPLLYLSLYLKQHRSDYYRLLDLVRHEGDWEAWIEFFLTGVGQTASSAVDTAQRLLALFKADEARLLERAGGASSMLRVYAALRARPIASVNDLARRALVSYPTAAAAVETFQSLKISRELTGRQRNRIFAYNDYIGILSEGAEPISQG